MPAIDTGNPVPSQEEYSEAAHEQKKSDSEEIHAYTDKRLRELVPSDDMYFAMENFLLGDPERQISSLDVDRLIGEGNDAKSEGQKITARTKYETAAKVELYRRKKDEVEQYLRFAQDVTERNDDHFKMQDTILSNLDSALDIAKKYYDQIPGAAQG
jgi:hypothetical protein